jgi:hypothetical protein
MTSLQQHLLELGTIWSRRDASWVADFEATLGSVAAFNDPSCIGPLLDLFEDESPSDDLLFSVVHAIERYPDHVYVAGLLQATETLLGRTPRWARILYMRILNAPTARAELASAICHKPESTRVSVGQILDDIERRRPELTNKSAEVRRNL